MALPLLQLIGFHLYLHKKAISTYEWIVRRDTDKLEALERKENERVRLEMERKGRARAIERANERTANFNSSQEKAKAKANLHTHRKHIKSEMVATMKRKVWALCSKTMKARSNGDSRVSAKYDASKEIAVDTNVDVKLSGLTSNGSTDDFPANGNGGDVLELKAQRHPEPKRRSCMCCFAKRRNAVGSLVWVKDRMQNYSNENDHPHGHGDVDDVIFGPDNVEEKVQVVEVVEEEPMEAVKVVKEIRENENEYEDEEEEEVRRSPRLLSAKFESDEEKV